VRQFEKTLERALILAGQEGTREEHFDLEGSGPQPLGAVDLLVEGCEFDAFERALILAALKRAGATRPMRRACWGTSAAWPQGRWDSQEEDQLHLGSLDDCRSRGDPFGAPQNVAFLLRS